MAHLSCHLEEQSTICMINKSTFGKGGAKFCVLLLEKLCEAKSQNLLTFLKFSKFCK